MTTETSLPDAPSDQGDDYRAISSARFIRRRGFLWAAVGGVASLSMRTALRAEQLPRPGPMIGAIRWDAWYDPQWPANIAATRALTPQQFHFRLPFFAKVGPDGGVLIDGGSQATMDAEIAQASHAGIDYWAFVAYPQNSGMSVALRLYLASSEKATVRFCMFTDLASFGTNGQLAPMILDHVSLMGDERYARVMQRRPLYYVGFFTAAMIAEHWGGDDGLRQGVADFRRRVIDAGSGNPYIVLSGRPAAAARWALQFGFDAIGAYAVSAGGTHPYADLAALAERRWDEEAATGVATVPTVMTGWDLRPRINALALPERDRQPGAGTSGFYETGKSAEIATHLGHALDWVYEHESIAVANTVLIYAWNENDEGGWLEPTFPFDDSRLRAVRASLCSWRARHRLSDACTL